jgi:hypothetical protein
VGRWADAAHLCSDLQHVFKCHANVRELVLEEHDDVVVVFLDLLCFRGLGTLLHALLDVRLQRRNLFVEVCDVLLDYEREFLRGMSVAVAQKAVR